jgi:hypothetical protein
MLKLQLGFTLLYLPVLISGWLVLDAIAMLINQQQRESSAFRFSSSKQNGIYNDASCLSFQITYCFNKAANIETQLDSSLLSFKLDFLLKKASDQWFTIQPLLCHSWIHSVYEYPRV